MFQRCGEILGHSRPILICLVLCACTHMPKSLVRQKSLYQQLQAVQQACADVSDCTEVHATPGSGPPKQEADCVTVQASTAGHGVNALQT